MKQQTATQNNLNDLIKLPKMGSTIEGIVIGTGRSAVYVDLGPTRPGIIYGREFLQAKNVLKNIQPGTRIKCKVLELENEKGYVELSLKDAQGDFGWDKLEEIRDKKETTKVKVVSANKGGLLATVFGIPAFLPVSQLSSKNYPKVDDRDGSKILKKLQEFVGQEIEVKIIDVSKKENKLIISEKATTQEISEILKRYKVGDIVQGEISEVTNFGAFVKFPVPQPDLEGLIHVSEIDWKIIKDPTEVLKPNDVVTAQIIKINDDGRIFLSIKILKKKPRSVKTADVSEDNLEQ